MSALLIVVTALAAAYALWGLLKPQRLYRFDVAVSLIFLAWVIPSMYVIENDGFSFYYDYQFTWAFILACQIMAYLGFGLGLWFFRHNAKLALNGFQYSTGRANQAAGVLLVVGLVGFVLMAREAGDTRLGGEWSGVITFYYFISQFILFAGALSWLVFLEKKNKTSALIFAVLIIVAVPIILYYARRGIFFQVAFIVFVSLWLVRRYRPPRSVVVVGLLFGFIFLNAAGTIRNHIAQENGTLVTAFTSGAVTQGFSPIESNPAGELKSALSDIEVTRRTGEYKPFVQIWNTAVAQFVPSFLLGRDFKDELMIYRSSNIYLEFKMIGSTRTGFSEAYSGYWYFGILLYLAIGVYQAKLWIFAESGDIRSQYYYALAMNYGLLSITESISRFLISMFIIYIASALLFRFIQLSPTESRVRTLQFAARPQAAKI